MTYSIEIKFAKGDKRITYTKEHIITEVVEGINGYKSPVWEVVSIEKVNKNNEDDTIKNILINNNEV